MFARRPNKRRHEDEAAAQIGTPSEPSPEPDAKRHQPGISKALVHPICLIADNDRYMHGPQRNVHANAALAEEREAAAREARRVKMEAENLVLAQILIKANAEYDERYPNVNGDASIDTNSNTNAKIGIETETEAATGTEEAHPDVEVDNPIDATNEENSPSIVVDSHEPSSTPPDVPGNGGNGAASSANEVTVSSEGPEPTHLPVAVVPNPTPRPYYFGVPALPSTMRNAQRPMGRSLPMGQSGFKFNMGNAHSTGGPPLASAPQPSPTMASIPRPNTEGASRPSFGNIPRPNNGYSQNYIVAGIPRPNIGSLPTPSIRGIPRPNPNIAQGFTGYSPYTGNPSSNPSLGTTHNSGSFSSNMGYQTMANATPRPNMGNYPTTGFNQPAVMANSNLNANMANYYPGKGNTHQSPNINTNTGGLQASMGQYGMNSGASYGGGVMASNNVRHTGLPSTMENLYSNIDQTPIRMPRPIDPRKSSRGANNGNDPGRSS